MKQVIILGVNYNEIMRKNTLLYRDILISEGVEEISKEHFLDLINKLGYKIDNSCTFNYYNDSNKHRYRAKAMSYKTIKGGISYAHYTQVYTNSYNLEKLQKIRLNYFVFDGRNIWEL